MIVSPVPFIKFSLNFFYFYQGVPWMVSPRAVRPPPSDTTENMYQLTNFLAVITFTLQWALTGPQQQLLYQPLINHHRTQTSADTKMTFVSKIPKTNLI